MKTNASDYESINDTKLDRVLVVISPDLVKPGAPKESPLIARAIALAKATGCELEFFHVSYDDSVTLATFVSETDLLREREKILDRDATLMSELIVGLKAEGVSIQQDTRWDSPRTDAILRKIRESRPDLVMKQSRDADYIMGVTNNTDWDLIRQSPAHVWFVTEAGNDQIDCVVTALAGGADGAADELRFSGVDYEAFRVANLIAGKFAARNFPVHAYQVPRGLNAYASYAPELGGPAYPQAGMISVDKARQEIASKHRRSIEAFARYFGLDPERVRLAEGHPSEVLPEAAKELSANLIVMAARNLSRWGRAFRSVTAEPVLADAPCDVLFVKDASDVSIPTATEPPIQGIPSYDLDQAVMDPQRAFGSPQILVGKSEISTPMKKRILQLWEQDVRAQMTEENEGGPVRATKADVLDAINRARTILRKEPDRRVEVSTELTH